MRSTGEQTFPLGELLERFDGLTARKVHYYISQRFVEPVVERGRNRFTERDVSLIGLIWKHDREGYRPRKAYDKAVDDMKGDQMELSLVAPAVNGPAGAPEGRRR